MKQTLRQQVVFTVMAWAAALVMAFPILWMVLAAFKTEVQAVTTPPLFVFEPTLENFAAIQQRANYLRFAWNSVFISFSATIVGLALAIPAAYALVFHPTRRTDFTLLWMLSTKMMPPVGALVPIYLIFVELDLLDNVVGLIAIYALINLPILVWMLYSSFNDVPREMLEASRIDGAKAWQELRYVLIPTTFPGIVAAGLLSIILCWNEAFWSLTLTSVDAAPLTAYIASFSSPEGLFWAKLSAASTLAIAPIVVLGWFSQRQLVSGLTFGAVK